MFNRVAMATALTRYYYKFWRSSRRKVGDGRDLEKPQDSTGAAVVVKKDGLSLGVVRRYGWEEIRRLTSDFSSAVVIGEGGFSTVYLAKLADPSGAVGAVKVHGDSERLYQAFKEELQVILHAGRHENLVRFVGYCDDGEQGSLVFDYVPNGTLHDKLHGGGEAGACGAVLTWWQRVSIAYELASAVDHLHENCHLPIVHNDIKPSNVLLDDGLHCKLCDFGSAKMGYPSARRHPVVGSPGYVDPHYLRTGVVSKMGDVYSYGVVVLELMTGMEAFGGERPMLTTAMGPWLRDADKRVEEVVDPGLAGDYDVGEAAAMMGLASMCLREEPSLRPSMAKILKVMEDKLCGSISTAHRKGGEVGA